jgi:hypothetical protein
MSMMDSAADWLNNRNAIAPTREARKQVAAGTVASGPPEDPATITRQLYVEEKGGVRTYYAGYPRRHEVMRATSDRVSTKSNDPQTVRAIMALAEARGWKEVALSGSKEFRREAWVQATLQGIATKGHRADDIDFQEVTKRRAAEGPDRRQPPDPQATPSQRRHAEQPREPIVVAAAKQPVADEQAVVQASAPQRQAAPTGATDGDNYWKSVSKGGDDGQKEHAKHGARQAAMR